MRNMLKNELIVASGLDDEKDSRITMLVNLPLDEFRESAPGNDEDLVNTISDLLAGLVSYDSKAKQWYLWNGKIHRTLDDEISYSVVKDYALYFMKTLRDEFWARHSPSVKLLTEDATQEQVKVHKTELGKLKTAIKGVDVMIETRLAFGGGQETIMKMVRRALALNEEQRALREAHSTRYWAFENGVLDMEKIPRAKELNNGDWMFPEPELLAHDKSRFIFVMTPHKFNWSAKAPSWKHFLSSDSFENNGEAYFFQQMLAIGMSGQVAEYKKYLVSLQGVTNSGKSMIADVMQKIYGKEYVTRSKSSIVSTVRGDGTEQNRQRLRIKDARLVFVSECTSNIDTSFILEYSGGDPYDVRKMSTDPETVVPKGILILTSNDGLKMDKSKPELFARTMPVNMPYRRTEMTHSVFWAEDDPNISGKYFKDSNGTINKPMDAGLDKKLISEAEGITVKLVKAFQHAKAQLPLRTESMEKRLNLEKMDADIFWIYITEVAELSEFDASLTVSKSVRVKDLFDRYKELAVDYQQKPMDIGQFGRKLNGFRHPGGSVMQTKASSGSRLVGYALKS